MSSVIIAGDTSGTVTLAAPAVSGTTTITLPATSGTLLQSGTAVTAAQGGTGLTAVGSSGNLLTSNGTAWTSTAPAAAGGMTLLGTIATTSGNSVSLGSLSLTNYKELRLVMQSVTVSATGYGPNISSDNSFGTPVSPWGYFNGTVTHSGLATINLVSGSYSSMMGFNSNAYSPYYAAGITSAAVTTASTIIYFRLSGVITFTAGSILVYGVA